MSRTTVELDFFGMEKDNSNPKPYLHNSLDRRRSFRGIQSAISKINPEVVKSVIASNNPFAPKASFSVPSTPKVETLDSFPPLPVYTPFMRTKPETEGDEDSSPLTIFYNGTVTVFNVPRDKAESILKLAVQGTDSKNVESENSSVAASSSSEQEHLLNSLNGDLPLFRKRSLQRFLEKRKERLTSVSPYVCHS